MSVNNSLVILSEVCMCVWERGIGRGMVWIITALHIGNSWLPEAQRAHMSTRKVPFRLILSILVLLREFRWTVRDRIWKGEGTIANSHYAACQSPMIWRQPKPSSAWALGFSHPEDPAAWSLVLLPQHLIPVTPFCILNLQRSPETLFHSLHW